MKQNRFSRAMILGGIAGVVGLGLGASARASEFVLLEPVTYAQPECVSVEIRDKIFEQRIPRLRLGWRCLDVNGVPIPNVDTGEADRTFVCDGAQSSQCTAENEPWDCCTGTGIGTCNDADMCYANLADFELALYPPGVSFSVAFDLYMRDTLCAQTPQLAGKCGGFL
jgi:hypothetical protein